MIVKFIIILLIIGTVVFQISAKPCGKCFQIRDGYYETKKLNRYLKNVTQDVMIPGLVAGISINGTQVWTHAIGQIDIENDVSTRINSVWRLASISKALTSALIGRLIDEGRVSLNQTIYQYLSPNVFPVKTWNNKTVNITLGQVMSHTAGLHDMEWPEDLYKKIVIKNVTDGIIVFKDEPLLFEPGTNCIYSNYGYQVVGAVIESVLNQTFENAINNMFKELEMNKTFCERREQIIPHRARYYMKSIDANNKTVLINTDLSDDLVSYEAYWPSGGIVSTIADLLKFGDHMSKWSKGLTTSQMFNLSNSTILELWTPVFDSSKIDPSIFYKIKIAHGWLNGTFDSPINCTRCKYSPIKDFIMHTGGMAGDATLLAIEPQNNIVVAFFTNIEANLKFYEIFETIFRTFLN